ncbi:NACHT and WD repeat domain-containing protein [Catellatospora chokoriensis]|uniref:Novel STAND NTPase 1 domain-containing protein n=1 Tax=Catellatospora chokoriensis TaxID=310353 RepID=A0A8J3NTU5_9ACTN|nr:WD40 repeat domain-containing protein [Catellatospora chokoriensis]GIF92128.1 hypothetical protein Cch02nite_55720 [Catellatospora chokoriensis]
MGLYTNLLTANPDSWPAPIRPVADHAWALATATLFGVGTHAAVRRYYQRVPRPPWSGDNPYPALEAFTEERAAVFFGRSDEVHELAARTMDKTPERRFIPVVGPSGAGKSSLVLAGALPLLARQRGWRIVEPITPGTAPVDALAGALTAPNPGTPLAKASLARELAAEAEGAVAAFSAGRMMPRPTTFVMCLERLRASAGRIVLVVDQLEEAVTSAAKEDRHKFVALLEAAVRHTPRLLVLCTLRSEFLGHFQQGPGSSMFRNPFPVNVMSPARLREVIEKPAIAAGVTLEAGLTDLIIAENRGADVLPLLSYLLHELYARHARDKFLSIREYRDASGDDGPIANRADAALVQAVSELTSRGCVDPRGLVLETLLGFVTLKNTEDADGADIRATRRRQPYAELSEEAQLVVDHFVDAYLLTSHEVARTGVKVIDLAHEALLRQWQPLADQISRHAEMLLRRTELEPLARAWDAVDRRVDYLISGERLRQAEQHATGATTLVKEFLTAAREYERMELDRRADAAARESMAELDPEAAVQLARAALLEVSQTPIARHALYDAWAAGLRAALRGHDHVVLSVAWSVDGRLASGSGDRTVRVWSADGRLLHTLMGHEEAVWSVAWSSGGLLASGGEDHTVRVWSTDGQLLHTLMGHEDTVRSVAWSVDGRLASGSKDGTIRVWSADGQQIHVLSGHESWVWSVAWSEDGLLASGGQDNTVRIWSGDGQMLHTLMGHEDPVRSVAWSGSDRLASGSEDGTVRVWSPEGQILHVLTGHDRWVWSVAWSEDGLLASGGEDSTVRVWSEDGQTLHTVASPGGWVLAVAWAGNGLLASGTQDRMVRVWSVDRQLLRLVDIGGGAVGSVAWSADGRLATGADDSSVRVWSADGQLLCTLIGPVHVVDMLAWSGDGLLATLSAETFAGDDSSVRVWSADGQLLCVVTGHHEDVRSVAWSADGRLATGGHEGLVRVWSAEGQLLSTLISHDGPLQPPEGELVRRWPGFNRWVWSLAWSVDGLLASGNADSTVRVWADGQVLHTLTGHEGAVRSVAWSADGLLLASGGEDGTVRVWSADGQLQRILTGHNDEIHRVAWSADGLLASGSKHGTVQVWSRDGQLLRILTGHEDPIISLAWAPNGLLASGSGDGTVLMRSVSLQFADLIEVSLVPSFRRLSSEERRRALLPPPPLDDEAGDADQRHS